MRKTLMGAALFALLTGAIAAQDEEAQPGAKILERTRADSALLLPQAGSGGSDKSRLNVSEQKQTEFKVEVQDYGSGFDPTGRGDEPPDLFSERGRGIFLMKHLMDRLEIDSQSGRGTRIIIAKKRKFQD